MSDIKVTGLSELQKLLDDLPGNIEKNVVRGGIRAAAKVVLEEAKRLAPVGGSNLPKGESPGDLRDSIRISMKVKKGLVTASINAGSNKAYYAHMVEFGTAQHFIKPKNRKSLFIAGLMKEIVDHPGAKAKPFMRPAIDSKAEEAINAMADYMRDRIAKEANKLK